MKQNKAKPTQYTSGSTKYRFSLKVLILVCIAGSRVEFVTIMEHENFKIHEINYGDVIEHNDYAALTDRI